MSSVCKSLIKKGVTMVGQLAGVRGIRPVSPVRAGKARSKHGSDGCYRLFHG
jgi:hypothetical protein